MRHAAKIGLLFGPAAAWILGAGAALGLSATAVPLDGPKGAVSGPGRCRSCHPREFASWAASYHRTMTQPVGPDARKVARVAASGAGPDRVLPPFGGETLTYLGFRATMGRSPLGVPHVRIEPVDEGGRPTGPPIVDADVALAVGSHRYQQFVAAVSGPAGPVGMRLPVAFDPDLGRWFHLGAAFLEPDGRPGSAGDYLRHYNPYNDNCIFCHNTEPVPGLTEDGGFRSHVGTFGIACEACHGPARRHAEAFGNPWRRVAAGTLTAAGRAGVFVPGPEAGMRGSDVCGRCHGQRIAPDLGRVLAHGDGFVPGGDLADVSRPIFKDSRLRGRPEVDFAARFWSDGTPRLSAYEYQGLRLSPCASDPAFGCATCHRMHGSDPRGQLRDGARDGRVCRTCHGAPGLSELPIHRGHEAAAGCLDCHMPRVTYGLLRTMRTHRVVHPVSPTPADGDAPPRPPACLGCHRGWDRAEAAAHGALEPAGDLAQACPESVPYLACLALGGDPIERAVALGWLAGPGRADPWTGGVLADLLEADYPALRWMAARAVRDRARTGDDPALASALAEFDPLAPPARRRRAMARLRRVLGPGPFGGHPAARSALAARRSDRAIWIGE